MTICPASIGRSMCMLPGLWDLWKAKHRRWHILVPWRNVIWWRIWPTSRWISIPEQSSSSPPVKVSKCTMKMAYTYRIQRAPRQKDSLIIVMSALPTASVYAMLWNWLKQGATSVFRSRLDVAQPHKYTPPNAPISDCGIPPILHILHPSHSR